VFAGETTYGGIIVGKLIKRKTPNQRDWQNARGGGSTQRGKGEGHENARQGSKKSKKPGSEGKKGSKNFRRRGSRKKNTHSTQREATEGDRARKRMYREPREKLEKNQTNVTERKCLSTPMKGNGQHITGAKKKLEIWDQRGAKKSEYSKDNKKKRINEEKKHPKLGVKKGDSTGMRQLVPNKTIQTSEPLGLVEKNLLPRGGQVQTRRRRFLMEQAFERKKQPKKDEAKQGKTAGFSAQLEKPQPA